LKFFLSIITLCSFFGLHAQNIKVSGKVFDEHTREAIPFANVYIKGTTQGVMTNLEGDFVISINSFQDSIVSSSVGFDKKAIKLIKGKVNEYVIRLKRSNIFLDEIVVKPGQNPAHYLLRKLWESREGLDMYKIPLWKAEVYTKVELDIDNIKYNKAKPGALGPFSFILDNIDTTSDQSPFLPVFLTESISDYYYMINPKKEREFIRASKLSGIKDKNLTQFLGGMYQKINIFENWITVLEKDFASPLSTQGLAYYKYYITDSALVKNSWAYKVSFMPKRKQEKTFIGEFWIIKGDFAILEMSMQMVGDANMNFIDRLSVYQSFVQTDQGQWVLEKDKLMLDFKSFNKSAGLIGRRTKSYKNFDLNNSDLSKVFEQSEEVNIAHDAYEKDNIFWQESRHGTLSANELGIYNLVDSLKNMPQFKSLVSIISGIVTGYYKLGPFDIGPYFSTLSADQVEGTRLRLGFRTNSDFSSRLQIMGYGAYGFKDKIWKYGSGASFTISSKPWQKIGINYRSDLDLESPYIDEIDQDNLFALSLRKPISQKLIRLEEKQMFYELEWFRGFSSTVSIINQTLKPEFDFSYIKEEQVKTDINKSSIGVRLRWNHKEEFISGKFNRISIGSYYPVLELKYEMGIKDVLLSDFSYNKLSFKVLHDFPLSPLGRLYFTFSSGINFDDVPYLLNYNPKGNDTYYHNYRTFNNMNPYEFSFKEYVELHVYHHFQGKLLDYVPLFRKLKWRSVLSVKAISGNSPSTTYGDNLKNISWDKPYLETGAGIENIFKVFRFDAVWRLTHTKAISDQDIFNRFGLYGSLQLQF
jgi:hypothetical protein